MSLASTPHILSQSENEIVYYFFANTGARSFACCCLFLLNYRIFEIAPDAISLYSFGEAFGAPASGHRINVPEDVFHLDAFKMHAKGVVSMLEKVLVMMLSNQFDDLAISLQELGGRHVSYNVHPAHYSVVEAALLRVLDGALGGNTELWNDDIRKGWAAVFKFVSKGMMNGAGSRLEITKKCRRMAEIDKSATLRLRVMPRSEGTSKLRRTKSLSPTRSATGTNRRRRKSPSPQDSKINKSWGKRNPDGAFWSPEGRRGSNRFDMDSTTSSGSIDRSPRTPTSRSSTRSRKNRWTPKKTIDPDYERRIVIRAMGEGRFASCGGHYFRDSLRSVTSLPAIPFDSEIRIEDIGLDDDDDTSIKSNESLVSTNSNDSIPKLPTRSRERGGSKVETSIAVIIGTDEEEGSPCPTTTSITSTSSHSISSNTSSTTCISNSGPPKIPSRRRGSFEEEQAFQIERTHLDSSNEEYLVPLNS